MATPNRLYTGEVLALATRLASYPWQDGFPFHGTARSATCGSTVELALDCDQAGGIRAIGLRTQACAIGQAAAALFAVEARGRHRAEIAQTLADLQSWLGGEGALPVWPGLAAIAPAQAYPARHGAVLLPWKAALAALPSDGNAR